MFIEGMVIGFSGSTENTDFLDRLRHRGWLLCNGDPIERTKYPRLFKMIGETYGAGDGNTTFQLPDYRGVFLRGLSMGSALDSGRRLGDQQKSAVERHTHKIKRPNSNTPGTDTAVLFATSKWGPERDSWTSENEGGANETRPINLAINYFIRCDIELA